MAARQKVIELDRVLQLGEESAVLHIFGIYDTARALKLQSTTRLKRRFVEVFRTRQRSATFIMNIAVTVTEMMKIAPRCPRQTDLPCLRLLSFTSHFEHFFGHQLNVSHIKLFHVPPLFPRSHRKFSPFVQIHHLHFKKCEIAPSECDFAPMFTAFL